MPPNIICVSIDSVRAESCSFLDAEKRTTPFLSRLSESSTVYESAITPSLWTLPVHTSIFTGLFPPEHGVVTGSERLGNQPTFAEQLHEAGYTTEAFYSNGWLDTADILRGFQSSNRGPEKKSGQSSTPTIKRRISNRIKSISPKLQGVVENTYTHYNQNRVKEACTLYRRWRLAETESSGRSATGNNAAIDTAIARAETNEIEEPFCWFTHLGGAHWPYKPPSPHHAIFTDRSVPELVKNAVYWQERVYGSGTNRLRAIVGEIDPPATETETFLNLYRGGIRYCDTLIRRLVESLKSAGVWDDTVFIVFGDHGDAFGEMGVFGHHFSMDESLIRVPLLIRDPTSRIPPDRVSEPVSLLDIYPTVLRLVGADVPENSGVDLSRGTRSEAFSYYNISEYDFYTTDYGVNKKDLPPPIQHTVWRSSSERLTHFPGSDDCHVIGDNERELWELLNEHRSGFKRLEAGSREIERGVQERLRHMGYLKE